MYTDNYLITEGAISDKATKVIGKVLAALANQFPSLKEDKPTLIGRGIDWIISKLPNPIKNALVDNSSKLFKANLFVGLIAGIGHISGLSIFAAQGASSLTSLMASPGMAAGAVASFSNPAFATMVIAGAILVAANLLIAARPSVRADLRNTFKTGGRLHDASQWSKEEDSKSGEINYELNSP